MRILEAYEDPAEAGGGVGLPVSAIGSPSMQEGSARAQSRFLAGPLCHIRVGGHCLSRAHH